MARIRVADILTQIAPNSGDAGYCATTAAGKQRIITDLSLAVRILINRVDDSGTTFWWKVAAASGCFAYPEDCLEARQVFINGLPALMHDEWYAGKLWYGLRDCGLPCALEVRDLGDFVTPISVPHVRPIRLALVAELDGDAGQEVVVEMLNEYGERVKETVTLLAAQQPAFTDNSVRDVTYFGKPRTFGPVKMQFYYDNGQRFHFATYGPLTRIGQFRRKKLPQRFWGCNEVTIKGKMRYYPVESEDDIIPFDDPVALSFAMSAVAALRKRDDVEYNQKLTFALQQLYKNMENVDSAGNVQQIQVILGSGKASGRKCFA